MEDALPILLEAIEEARACGAKDVERMAIHDLGIAKAMFGDVRAGLALIEESMELARAANDRFLLTRCYINVPSIMSGNGETNDRTMPIFLEGLDRAKRMMDNATASWIAQNIADLMGLAGRLSEAVSYAEEALAAARTLGEAGRIEACLGQRALARLAMGDRAGAHADIAVLRQGAKNIEPQNAIYHSIFDALFLWPDDPLTACRSFSEALNSTDVAPGTLLDAAPIAARMALRVGDASRLGASVSSFLDVAARCSGPVRALQRRWMEALPREPAAGPPALRAVADEFEAIGYRLPAADCHADAALLARRADLDPAADEAAALRLYAACGAVPVLGELPEKRWVGAAETAARPA
jgi:hypothetical protein